MRANGSTVVNFNAEPWTSINESFAKRGARGDFKIKLLTAPDGKKVGIVHANGEGMPHFHTRASSYFILDGEMILRDRVVGPGIWGIEPYGAVHPNTIFRNVTYGLGMTEGDFGVGNVVLRNTDELPEWALQAGFKNDDFSTLANTREATWIPFGDKLWIKVIYIFERGGAFASIVKAEAGAKLAKRRYMGPTDMYFLSGNAKFGSDTVSPGCWVHEPAGAIEEPIEFSVDTEFLVNAYGSIVELSETGAVSRVIDGSSLRNLALVKADGGQSIGNYSESEFRQAVQQFVTASTIETSNAGSPP